MEARRKPEPEGLKVHLEEDTLCETRSFQSQPQDRGLGPLLRPARRLRIATHCPSHQRGRGLGRDPCYLQAGVARFAAAPACPEVYLVRESRPDRDRFLLGPASCALGVASLPSQRPQTRERPRVPRSRCDPLILLMLYKEQEKGRSISSRCFTRKSRNTHISGIARSNLRQHRNLGKFAPSLLLAVCSIPAASGQTQSEEGAPRLESQPTDMGSALEDDAGRTSLNLLGQVDSEEGEARRNENVRITLIDNNVLRELTIRMGTTATVPLDTKIEDRYFATEFGQPPKRSKRTSLAQIARARGELRWTHQNSATSARSFFQVGSVRPAHDNGFGFAFGMPAWHGSSVLFEGNQVRSRGNVNGNVLVPAPNERTPLTRDQERRAYVQRLLDAYPDELPNRTDINPRALNTNDLQDIDNDRGAVRIRQAAGHRDHLVLHYGFTSQKVDAFQLVGGQNPDTTTRNHLAIAGWNRTWSSATTTEITGAYERVSSLLVSEESAVGPLVLTGFVTEFLGPGSNIPIDRALNRFTFAARAEHLRSDHSWTVGTELIRRQVNGSESESHRGLFFFRNDFGRNTVTNILLGTPSVYRVAIGNIHRGFRNWAMQYYLGDKWKVSDSLTVSLGIRYEPVTAPKEVLGLTTIPYDCDCNNLASRFGFAYRLGGTLGVLRGSYGIHYGQIFDVSYGQSRFSPPENINITVQAPDLVHPLGRLTSADFDPHARSTVFSIDPELATPYSHQYGLDWQLPIGGWSIDLGYVGSRTHKLLTLWYTNRAQPVPGIPQTTRTVNRRRPDPRFFDNRLVLNGSRAFFDAAKIVLRIPDWRGLTMEASYWWSKAIDLGSDFSNSAAGRSGRLGRSQSEFNSHAEMRSVSAFDQPHGLLARAGLRLPTPRKRSWRFFGGWLLSTVVLAKSGTPFDVVAGSDGEGFGNVDGSAGDRPDLADPAVLGRSVDDPDTSADVLPKSAFVFIRPTAKAGNLGRNVFRKDGIFNINAALSKQWAMGGDASLLFRTEALNLLNHPQFAEPGQALTAPNFGQITNTLNDGRAFRFSLQLTF